jgi:hypothetical protein
MTVTEQFIYDTLTNYGYFGLFLALLLLGGIATVIAYITSWLKDMVFTIYKSRKVRKDVETLLDSDDADLTAHKFFTEVKYKIKYEIPEMKLAEDKPVLSHMYHDLITITVESVYNRMEELCSLVKSKGCGLDHSGEAWIRHVRQALNAMLDDVEEKAIRENVPTIFVRRYMRWLISYTDIVKDDAITIANTELYEGCTIRTYTFLLSMNIFTTSIMGDLKNLVNSVDSSGVGGQYHGRDIEV